MPEVDMCDRLIVQMLSKQGLHKRAISLFGHQVDTLNLGHGNLYNIMSRAVIHRVI